MNGYVENIGEVIEFAFQKQVRPGEKINLERIYKLLGYNKGFKFNIEFVNWLRTQKLNSAIWNVVVTFDENAVKEEKPVPIKETGVVSEDKSVLMPPPIKYTAEAKLLEVSDTPVAVISPKDVAGAPLRKARSMVSELETDEELREVLVLIENAGGKATLKEIIIKKLNKNN